MICVCVYLIVFHTHLQPNIHTQSETARRKVIAPHSFHFLYTNDGYIHTTILLLATALVFVVLGRCFAHCYFRFVLLHVESCMKNIYNVDLVIAVNE